MTKKRTADKQKRLEQALRENLRKRKEYQHTRSCDSVKKIHTTLQKNEEKL